MERTQYKKLQKLFRNVKDCTGADFVFFSFLNEKSNLFEIKIIDGNSKTSNKATNRSFQKFFKEFAPVNYSFSGYSNPHLKKIIDKKTHETVDLLAATKNVFSKDAVATVQNLLLEPMVTTFPVVLEDVVKGIISFIYSKNNGNINQKTLTKFVDHTRLYIESILDNEKLALEVKEKTLKLEQEKVNLEANVKERTQKLDNSRSALLHMLKDIDKSAKKLASAKEYTDNIIRSMIETLVVVSTDATIQTANKSTLELLGYTEDELVGHHFSKIFPDHNVEMANALVNELIKKDFVSNVEKTYLTKDGIEIPIVFSASVMKESEDIIQGIVCIASDITIRKKHERDVHEQNVKIEKANEELKAALKKAEESDKLKTAFLQNMSHEIRTPLNGIVGFSQLLSSKDYPEANKLEIAKLVERSSFRLIELVNNILDVAKIETGQVEINSSAFNLNNFLREIQEFFSLFAKEKKLELVFDSFLADNESVIYLDKEKLHQIMINLVNNAIKFTNQGEIKFGYAIKDDVIEFFVKDTGVGIPEEFQDRVFDRFIQADVALTRNYEGSGLGLSICKGLTELLGGKMWLTSVMGKETVFYFTVPYFPASINGSGKSTAIIDLEKLKRTLHILIAEDDDINFKFVHYLFINSKHKIIRAVNGKEAVDMVMGPDKFDIILMDIKMPIMSGYEATSIIKSRYPKIPIIALTAYAFEEDRQKALKVGCDDFIQKAYRKETLFEKIYKLVSK